MARPRPSRTGLPLSLLARGAVLVRGGRQRVLALGPAAARPSARATFTPAAAVGGYARAALREPLVALPRHLRQSRRRVRRARRAVARVQVRRARARATTSPTTSACRRSRSTAARAAARRDVELRAPSDVLVRPHAVRLGVRAGVHEEVHARLRHERPRRAPNPAKQRLHRQAPGQRVHGAPVLRAGLRPAVRGLRLLGAPVLRGDDDRQPDPRPEHRGRATPALRQLHPRRRRADQLGVHHQERCLPGAGRPAVHRDLRRTRTSPRSTRTSPRTC